MLFVEKQNSYLKKKKYYYLFNRVNIVINNVNKFFFFKNFIESFNILKIFQNEITLKQVYQNFHKLIYFGLIWFNFDFYELCARFIIKNVALLNNHKIFFKNK